MFFACQVLNQFLMERDSLRRGVDDVGFAALREALDGFGERFGHEHHAAASVAVVVDLPVVSLCEVAKVHDFDFELARRDAAA